MVSTEEKLAFEAAKNALRKARLIVPLVGLRHSKEWYSWTDCKNIYLGKTQRLGHELTITRLEPLILHELVHVLIDRVPIDRTDKKTFGTHEEWEADSDFTWRFPHNLIVPKGYVSAHASVHPEEDFVETAAYILDDATIRQNTLLRRKVAVVKRWFRKIQHHKRRD